MKRTLPSLIAVVALAGVVAAVRVHGQNQGAPAFNEQLLRVFSYGNVGPFRMQARMAAIDVPTSPAKDHLYTMYTAPWIGGVWKTTNNGTTFEPLFDNEVTQSIGDVTRPRSRPG